MALWELNWNYAEYEADCGHDLQSAFFGKKCQKTRIAACSEVQILIQYRHGTV